MTNTITFDLDKVKEQALKRKLETLVDESLNEELSDLVTTEVNRYIKQNRAQLVREITNIAKKLVEKYSGTLAREAVVEYFELKG